MQAVVANGKAEALMYSIIEVNFSTTITGKRQCTTSITRSAVTEIFVCHPSAQTSFTSVEQFFSYRECNIIHTYITSIAYILAFLLMSEGGCLMGSEGG